ncbi:MAG TPA: hypothetical protein VHP38_13405, partial [Ruminiclostridium sp.]|nr:hypothetical protein [Ruminiclostridium sp.]
MIKIKLLSVINNNKTFSQGLSNLYQTIFSRYLYSRLNYLGFQELFFRVNSKGSKGVEVRNCVFIQRVNAKSFIMHAGGTSNTNSDTPRRNNNDLLTPQQLSFRSLFWQDVYGGVNRESGTVGVSRGRNVRSGNTPQQLSARDLFLQDAYGGINRKPGTMSVLQSQNTSSESTPQQLAARNLFWQDVYGGISRESGAVRASRSRNVRSGNTLQQLSANNLFCRDAYGGVNREPGVAGVSLSQTVHVEQTPQ